MPCLKALPEEILSKQARQEPVRGMKELQEMREEIITRYEGGNNYKRRGRK